METSDNPKGQSPTMDTSDKPKGQSPTVDTSDKTRDHSSTGETAASVVVAVGFIFILYQAVLAGLPQLLLGLFSFYLIPVDHCHEVSVHPVTGWLLVPAKIVPCSY